MSIPSSDRIEYPVSTLGTETQPQGILAKGTLWTLQLGYSSLFIKEYGGYSHELDALSVKTYTLTAALNLDLSINSDRLWVWVVDLQDVLSLYEVEPYTTSTPVTTYSKINIATDINSMGVSVGGYSPVRIAALFNTNEFKSIGYENIRLSDPPVIADLKWDVSRLNQFDVYSPNDRTALEITYLDVASPPNVYLESYTLATPTGLSVSQVGDTNEILISWDALLEADSYILDRDTTPAFLLPVSIATSLLVHSDFIPVTGTYYYRIRAVDSTILLWSPPTSTEQVIITLNAGFFGTPLSAFIGNIVSFTDTSTPAGTVTSWDWDFGDGSSHSTDQNPTHMYLTSGLYTVTLLVHSGLESDTATRIDYITIVPPLIAEFTADRWSGLANLLVQFTDQSFGAPISWDWDFGDSSSHSMDQNPFHEYTKSGVHTVTLVVADGTNIRAVAHDVTVDMFPDFSSDIQVGLADLTVSFMDHTLGEPLSWDWDFGDGAPHSTLQNPVHTYRDSGSYSVTLTVFDGAHTFTILKGEYINVYRTYEPLIPIPGGGFTRHNGPSLIFD